jgi:hypothetical protein
MCILENVIISGNKFDKNHNTLYALNTKEWTKFTKQVFTVSEILSFIL